MSYEYTDIDDARLRVETFRGSRVGEQVHITTSRDGAYVKPEDAPAVALAILEAAGIEPAGGPHFANVAVRVLKDHVQHQAERAEREAEDAKVREFRKAVFPGIKVYESITHRDRDNYRAAREFFTRDEGISVEALAEALGHELPEG